MAVKYQFTDSDLTSLRKRAEKGDESARRELEKDARRLAKIANSRLLRLERSGMEDSQAYRRSTFFLTDIMRTTPRFKVNKKLDTDELIQEYKEMKLFLSKESSTVKGMLAAENRLIDALEKYDINIDKSKRREFTKFIGSQDIQDAIELIGDYDVVMDAIAENLSKYKGQFDRLAKQFNAFLNGDIFYDELLEKIGGRSLEELYNRHRRRNIRDKRR